MSKYSEQIKLWQDPSYYPGQEDWDDSIDDETWGGDWEDDELGETYPDLDTERIISLGSITAHTF